jgi:hypothetical protein
MDDTYTEAGLTAYLKILRRRNMSIAKRNVEAYYRLTVGRINLSGTRSPITSDLIGLPG